MKHLIFFPMLIAGVLPPSGLPAKNNFSVTSFVDSKGHTEGLNIQSPTQDGGTKMRAAVFKAQDYCRAELKDFEFDIEYKVVGAVVYFSGTNFQNVEKGIITSNSLKPVKPKMERCAPGTIVIFDEVKVMGPDNIVRTIPGISLILI